MYFSCHDYNNFLLEISERAPYIEPLQALNEDSVTLEVVQTLQKLKESFIDIYHKTKKCFEHNEALCFSDVIEYVKAHVELLLGVQIRTLHDKQAARNEFNHTKTLPQLFTFLEDKYISWFNYEFIVKLAGIFLKRNHKLQKAWTAYHDKLKDYFINCDGLAIQCVDAVQFGLPDMPPGTRIVVAKVDRTDYTINDLVVFRSGISQFLMFQIIHFISVLLILN